MIRTKPLKRSPLKRKPRKKRATDDKAYLDWIRTLKCCVPRCAWQSDYSPHYPTEAHHAGDHGYAQTAPDRTAIPLCSHHHRFGSDAVHVLGKNFWNHHTLDRDAIIQSLNERYNQECLTR